MSHYHFISHSQSQHQHDMIYTDHLFDSHFQLFRDDISLSFSISIFPIIKELMAQPRDYSLYN